MDGLRGTIIPGMVGCYFTAWGGYIAADLLADFVYSGRMRGCPDRAAIWAAEHRELCARKPIRQRQRPCQCDVSDAVTGGGLLRVYSAGECAGNRVRPSAGSGQLGIGPRILASDACRQTVQSHDDAASLGFCCRSCRFVHCCRLVRGVRGWTTGARRDGRTQFVWYSAGGGGRVFRGVGPSDFRCDSQAPVLYRHQQCVGAGVWL